MCRLFGVLSTCPEPDFSADLLRSPISLLAQSQADPKRLQTDGWGVAWSSGATARVLKSAKAIFQETAKLIPLTRTLSLAHIRRASNALHLPKNQLIGVRHSQPFIFGRWSFVHNGCLNIPNEVRRRLGPRWERRIRGRNDSEVLFWLLMKHVAKDRGVPSAFRSAVREINSVWKGLSPRPRGVSRPYWSLNIILTDGRRLWALCKYDGLKPSD